MKRQALLVFFTLAVSLTAMSQTISIDLKEAGKSVSTANAQFIGSTDDRVYLVEGRGMMKYKFSLVSYDYDRKEQARVDLGSGNDVRPYGGFINGQHIDLLEVAYPENGMRVYRNRHSLATLEPEGDTLVLGNYSGQKNDEFNFAIAASPNGQLLAAVFVAQYKGQGTDVKVGLYNHELEEYWTLPVTDANFNSMAVTDDGDVILYALGSNGKCHFTVVDGEHADNIEFTTAPDGDAKILDRAFLRYGNGKILVAAGVREENYTIMPNGTNIDRVDIYCYDIAKRQVNVVRHPLTDQETQRINNSREGGKVYRHWIQYGQIAQTLADKDGAYVMIEHAWTVTQNGMPSEYHMLGMMLMRVDAEGNIKWTRTKRFEAMANHTWRSLIIQRWRTTPDGIVLAWADNAKNVASPVDKPCRKFKPSLSKSVLNVWTITPDGKESRSYTPIGRLALHGSLHPMDTPGKYFAFLRLPRKEQWAVIQIGK